MLKKKEAARAVLVRYIITNLLILLIPLLIAIVYYVVSSKSIEKSIDSIVELQLESNIQFIDQRLKRLEKEATGLLVDYELNRYLNMEHKIEDIDLYNSGRISARLSSILIGSDFLSRSYIYLRNSDKVIIDNGFSDYSTFYGPLFSVTGYDAESWKQETLFNHNRRTYLITGLESSESGLSHPSHIFIQSSGTGTYYRGSFVAVINTLTMGRTLTKLPGLYGGWLLVTDASENLIACSSVNEGETLSRLLIGKRHLNSMDIEGQKYLKYSLTSSYNGWNYIALLNENLITADLIKVRNTALFLLLIGFILGIFLSFLMAFTNSRPLARLFSLLQVPPEASVMQVTALYSHLEESIQKLSDTKNELELEVKSASATAQTYFLQSLLRGEYHNRTRFSVDRDSLNIILAAGSYFVIICRLSPLAMAIDTRNHGEIMTALLQRLTENIFKDEYAIQASTGFLAIIMRAHNQEDYRTIAMGFMEKILAGIEESLKENLLFGIGEPVSDPFLLPISYNEAEASNLSLGPEQRNPVCFHNDFPASNFTYSYPLHVEEAICRAVRCANTELLNSLLEGLKEENLTKKSLGRQESENLVLALRGTSLRIMNEFPGELAPFNNILNTAIATPSGPKAFENAVDILYKMTEVKSKGKRSHNDSQALEIRRFISDNFRDFNLGLSSIAEKFNLSENYLSSFFKEQEGEGLSNYIQRIRLTEASTLLAIRHDISIEKIGANCGYPNASSFRRAFKRVYGISPSEYRVRDRIRDKKGISIMKRTEIQIRDPFILPQPGEGLYYMFGTTDSDPWGKSGEGFDFYTSKDLENWKGPFPAFRPDKNFWGTRNFWAPEVHFYKGAYYMFATFKAENIRRGTQILHSGRVSGPFIPLTSGPVTPADWECLDGTLYVDKNMDPWIIFCHEWVQVNDGEICARRLSTDLKEAIGDPVLLFRGSEAPWTKGLPRRDGSSLKDARVTDGPFIYNTKEGGLLLIWSSMSRNGYALGAARSESGTLSGPWIQSEHPISDTDGGHGMVFRSFEGRLFLSYHCPNNTPEERFQYTEIIEKNRTLVLSD